jgi:hypothetical protein
MEWQTRPSVAVPGGSQSGDGSLFLFDTQIMGITTGSLTVQADWLERSGLIARKPHETDRRSIRVGLTAEGERIAAEHHQLHTLLSQEISTGFYMAEIDAVVLYNLESFIRKRDRAGIHISKAYLFGSHARGTADKWSDIGYRFL